MLYQSLQELCEIAEREKTPLWEIVVRDTCIELSIQRQEAIDRMWNRYQVMRIADRNYDGRKKSGGGMAGGDGEKLRLFCEGKQNISGKFIGKVMERAIKMAETNACMGRIVAAPTAGSCGVLPAVLLSYEEKYLSEQSGPKSKELLAGALFTASGIGQIIARKASLAGAAGGCQAEIGSASAMAAAALIFLRGGSNEQSLDGAAIALKSLMGLVCDPVGGLVEVPCVKRNVIGAVNAVTASDMVLAGISSIIPADEVIEAMGEVGRDMPKKYRETSMGGLATTPTGQKLAENIWKRENQKGSAC